MFEITQDEKWMREAIKQAQKAMEIGEVPVGAVVVRDGNLIASAYNLREMNKMPTAHAEVLAIEEACKTLGCKWLQDCTLYVTLEPCPMCAGALIGARIGRVVFGAKDARAGACGRLLLQVSPRRTGGVPLLRFHIPRVPCPQEGSDPPLLHFQWHSGWQMRGRG